MLLGILVNKLSDTEWDWDNIFGGTTDSICNLLQVNKAADSSKEWERGGESIRRGGWQWCPRPQQQQEQNHCCYQCSLRSMPDD